MSESKEHNQLMELSSAFTLENVKLNIFNDFIEI